jgi:hypothetical protein
MKVFYERSGGFAGMRIQGMVDSNLLPPDQANELEENLKAASFFDLPEQLPSTQGGADRFHYKITVERGDQKHAVEFDEAAADVSLQSLVQQLNSLARAKR